MTQLKSKTCSVIVTPAHSLEASLARNDYFTTSCGLCIHDNVCEAVGGVPVR